MNFTSQIQNLDKAYGQSISCPLYLPLFPHIDANINKTNMELALVILSYLDSLTNDTVFLEESKRRKCNEFVESFLRFSSISSSFSFVSNSSSSVYFYLHILIWKWIIRCSKLALTSLSVLLILEALYVFASNHSKEELQAMVVPWYQSFSSSSSPSTSSFLSPLLSFSTQLETSRLDRYFTSLTLLHECYPPSVEDVSEEHFIAWSTRYTELSKKEKASCLLWASTWLEYHFQKDQGWTSTFLESMFSLLEPTLLDGEMFENLPFMMDLAKSFSVSPTYETLKHASDPLFRGTYEKLHSFATKVSWPHASNFDFSTLPSEPQPVSPPTPPKAVSPLRPYIKNPSDRKPVLAPVDRALKNRVLAYVYNDDVDEELLDEPSEEDDDDERSDKNMKKKDHSSSSSSSMACPVELKQAFVSDPDVFDRKAKTSKARAQLRVSTGLDDEQIEGWGSFLRRNPKELKNTINEFSGSQTYLPTTRYRRSTSPSSPSNDDEVDRPRPPEHFSNRRYNNNSRGYRNRGRKPPLRQL